MKYEFTGDVFCEFDEMQRILSEVQAAKRRDLEFNSYEAVSGFL